MRTPKHVAFILDGNRRFGELVLNDRLAGHSYGSEKLNDVLEWCRDFGIKVVTVWAFSTENFNRPEEEVELLMDLFEKKFNEISESEKIHKNGVRIQADGRLDMFPKRVRKAVRKAVDSTKLNKSFFVNFALAYGGKQEIVDVAKRVSRKILRQGKSPEEIDEQDLNTATYFDLPDIDLIIRTGGVKRTSGFMPLKGAYAEWYFCEKFWPEFDKSEFIRALTDYSGRQRRFGR